MARTKQTARKIIQAQQLMAKKKALLEAEAAKKAARKDGKAGPQDAEVSQLSPHVRKVHFTEDTKAPSGVEDNSEAGDGEDGAFHEEVVPSDSTSSEDSGEDSAEGGIEDEEDNMETKEKKGTKKKVMLLFIEFTLCGAS